MPLAVRRREVGPFARAVVAGAHPERGPFRSPPSFRRRTARLKSRCGRSRFHRRRRRYRGGGYRRRPPGLVRLAARRPTKASTSNLGSRLEPLEVWAQGQSLKLSQPKHRVLLAALLLAKLFEDGHRDQLSKRNRPALAGAQFPSKGPYQAHPSAFLELLGLLGTRPLLL
jgi:hypothetical protein